MPAQQQQNVLGRQLSQADAYAERMRMTEEALLRLVRAVRDSCSWCPCHAPLRATCVPNTRECAHITLRSLHTCVCALEHTHTNAYVCAYARACVYTHTHIPSHARSLARARTESTHAQHKATGRNAITPAPAPALATQSSTSTPRIKCNKRTTHTCPAAPCRCKRLCDSLPARKSRRRRQCVRVCERQQAR